MELREQLQIKLENLFGNKNVYYQPPTNLLMKYPAIRYSKKDIISRYADDTSYSIRDCYEVIVIDQRKDNPVIKKLLQLPYCSFDRHYVSDNLNHDVLTLYY